METEELTDHNKVIITEKTKLSIVEGADYENYDPHIHRKVANPTTNFQTLTHLLKGCLGTGILAMHQAFYNSGYLNGLVSIIVIGIICTYCFHVLIRSQYLLCKKHKVPLLSYPDSMRMALESGPNALKKFSSSAAPIVDGFLVIYQLGVCVCYIVFVASNIKQIVDVHWIVLDVKIHMLIILLPLLAMNSIKNLKVLAPFSSFANLITFVGLGLVLYYVFQELPSINDREMIADIARYPLYFGTTLFALEAVGVVIALENNMQNPKDFGKPAGVLNVGMVIIVFLYALVGFFGYIKYGAASQGSITLDLPQDQIIAQITKLIFAFAIFISYALQCFVPVQIIWQNYVEKKITNNEKKPMYEFVLRLVITLITFLLAAAIPRLGLFISLFGAFCLSALGLAFPAIMEICVLWNVDDVPISNFTLWKDIILIVVSIIGLVSGTYTAIRDIVLSFM